MKVSVVFIIVLLEKCLIPRVSKKNYSIGESVILLTGGIATAMSMAKPSSVLVKVFKA